MIESPFVDSKCPLAANRCPLTLTSCPFNAITPPVIAFTACNSEARIVFLNENQSNGLAGGCD